MGGIIKTPAGFVWQEFLFAPELRLAISSALKLMLDATFCY
jgi:hypothetical protein